MTELIGSVCWKYLKLEYLDKNREYGWNPGSDQQRLVLGSMRRQENKLYVKDN